MKHVLLNNDGIPVAFYDDDIHKDIPNDCIKITCEQYREYRNNRVGISEVKTARKAALDDLDASDRILPRYAEDIISVIGIDKFPAIVQERVAKKKELRNSLINKTE